MIFSNADTSVFKIGIGGSTYIVIGPSRDYAQAVETARALWLEEHLAYKDDFFLDDLSATIESAARTRKVAETIALDSLERIYSAGYAILSVKARPAKAVVRRKTKAKAKPVKRKKKRTMSAETRQAISDAQKRRHLMERDNGAEQPGNKSANSLRSMKELNRKALPPVETPTEEGIG